MTDAAGNSHSGTYHADNGSSTDYTYTSHGSLKTDGNRGISNIAYNTYLNRASQVSFSNGSWLKNTYDGAGSVIKREKSNGETWHYVDRFVIKNGQLYSINIPDGRLIKNGANWEKEFYYKDHLGSSVVTFSEQNGQLVAKEYAPVDPFGLDLFGINQANTTKDNFTYQSKEKLDDFGILGTNDFGARIFDKHSLRWWAVDPLAEKREWLTLYNMASNNPINRIDPDGNADFGVNDDIFINSKSKQMSVIKTNDNFDRIIIDGSYKGNTTKGFAQSVWDNNDLPSNQVAINYGSNADPSTVSLYTKATLIDIMNETGNESIKINSTTRSPEAQARVMSENVNSQGMASQKKLYGASGDKVLDLHPDVKKMTNKINELGPTNVSKHCCIPSQMNVVDVSPRASLLNNPRGFAQSAINHPNVRRVLSPYNSKDPAIHIEIPQPRH
jgi:RHS repeat-associated protein